MKEESVLTLISHKRSPSLKTSITCRLIGSRITAVVLIGAGDTKNVAEILLRWLNTRQILADKFPDEVHGVEVLENAVEIAGVSEIHETNGQVKIHHLARTVKVIILSRRNN